MCLRRCSIVRDPDVGLVRHPEPMQENGQSPGDGDDGSLLRGFAASPGQPKPPTSQIRVRSEGPEHIVR
jgi:hypothetical protein